MELEDQKVQAVGYVGLRNQERKWIEKRLGEARIQLGSWREAITLDQERHTSYKITCETCKYLKTSCGTNPRSTG